MKKIILIFIQIFICFNGYCQDIFSKFEKYDFDKKQEFYREIIKVNDNNTLIIKLNEQNLISCSSSGFFKYMIDVKEKILIDKVKLSTIDSLWISENLNSIYNINPEHLNIEKKENVTLIINDGVNFNIEFYKKNYFLFLNSYSSKEYIEDKFPHYEERIVFINFVKKLNKICEDSKIDKIKNSDDIYIIYDDKIHNNNNISLVKKTKDIYEYSLNFSNSNKVLFLFYNLDKNNLTISLENLLLISNNKNSVFISASDFYDKRYSIISYLAREKKIYIIEKKSLLKKYLSIKLLKLISF